MSARIPHEVTKIDRTFTESPFCWWGPALEARPRRSLCWLVERGMLSAPVAGLLAATAGQRLSIAVVAEPAGAGKTTLLTAALAHLPPPVRRIYLRGSWESFAFLDDPAVVPGRDALLANEISPHLPEYLWGTGAARMLAAGGAGFALYATAHARDGREFAGQLAAPPISAPAAHIAGFHVVVAISVVNGKSRVDAVWALVPKGDGRCETRPICGGHSGLAGVAEGLARAMDAGWLPGGEVPGAETIEAAIARLHDADVTDPDPERPAAMLARSRAGASRGNAGSG